MLDKKFIAVFFVLFTLFILSPLLMVLAVTSQNTTMTWLVPANRSFTATYGGSCSATAFFFNETITQDDGDIDGNGTRTLPSHTRTGTDANCQSATVDAITITNNGNTTYDVNAAFVTDQLDTNTWLKVWQGNGAGCGTGGFGGWSLRCYLTAAENYTFDVNETSCRDWNSETDLISQTLIVSLAQNDSNELCFSGDFLSAASPPDSVAAAVTQGDHNATFQIISEGS